MRIGQIFRTSRPYRPEPETIDGLPNYFYHTFTPNQKLPLLDSGINAIGDVKAPDGPRCSAILISSSPHRIGSPNTPWQDFFDPDRGHIRYYGDNKTPESDPTTKDGNRALLAQFALYASPEASSRIISCPIICFKRIQVGQRIKGNVQFQGYGIITRAERITQYHRKRASYFTNYVFDISILSLAGENEDFNWQWISARRDPNMTAAQTLVLAPEAWQVWVREGNSALEKCRRRVSKLITVSKKQQIPELGSKEYVALQVIYSFYGKGRKNSRFEALASAVVGRILSGNGQAAYHQGWITPTSSDGGADFVGRMDVGSELAGTRLIVLGQAKCERLSSPTGGNHIARTVARLKRGWIGVYVTTSFFSEPVQREVWDDKYPIVLINGRRLAREVLAMVHEHGFPDVRVLLEAIDRAYETQVARRNPEEILLD